MRKKPIRLVMIMMAVILMATNVTYAQRGNRAAAGSCCLNIPGLSDEQKSSITTLEQQHLKEMQEMRDARRKSGNYADRDAYQAEVDRKVTDHRNAVRNLLNTEQKTFFDNIQAQGGQGRNRQANMSRGQGQQRGNLNRGRR